MALSFDRDYYLQQNPDVAAAGVDPEAHFNQFGFKEGRDPSAFFDTSYYLAQNPDVAGAGVNPFVHFNQFGLTEQRPFTPFFDAKYYAESNPDVVAAGANPIDHFLKFGITEAREFSPFFDADFYKQENPDVAAAGVNPIEHFMKFGVQEKRDINPFFDVKFYEQQNPDVLAAGINPLQHFLEHGIKELRNPNVDVNMQQIATTNANFQQALTEGKVEVMRGIIGNAAEVIKQGGTITQAVSFAAQDNGQKPFFIPQGGVDQFFTQNNIPPAPPFVFNPSNPPAGGFPPPPNGAVLPPPPPPPGSAPVGTVVTPPSGTFVPPSASAASKPDTHLGTASADNVTGTTGNDVFALGLGNDTITGNGGSDIFKNNGTDGVDVLMDFDTANDKIAIAGLAKEYHFSASSGSKLQFKGVTGSNKTGGFTFENTAYSNAPTEVDGDYANSIEFDNGGKLDIRTASFTVVSSDNLNILSGAAAAQTLTGLAASDLLQITASGANNVLVGAEGNDTLVGYTGVDYLNGGTGADVIIAGTGADVIRYAIADNSTVKASVDTINDFTVNTSGDVIDFTDITLNTLRGAGTGLQRGDGTTSTTALGDNVGFFVATNDIGSDFNEATIYTALAGIAPEVLANDMFYAAVSDGTDTAIVRITDVNSAGTLVAATDTLEYITTLSGVTHSHLVNFLAANTADFTSTVRAFASADVHATQGATPVVSGFSATGNVIDIVGLTATTLRGAGTGFAKANGTTGQTLGTDVGFYVATNDIGSDFNEATIYTALSGIADELAANDEDMIYALVSDGTDSVLVRITEKDNIQNTAAVALNATDDLLEYVATFSGVTHTNLNDLVAGNTADFT